MRAIAAHILHSDRAVPVEANLACPGAGLETYIASAKSRAQEGIGSRTGQAGANGHLGAAETRRARPVEIIRPCQPQLPGSIRPVLPHRMQVRSHVLHIERPVAADAARRIDAPLGSFEVGAHIVPAPADIAHAPPIVEVLRHAPAIDQSVDGARAPQHLAPRPIDAPSVESRIRSGLVLPIDLGIGECAAVSDGRPDPESPIRAAGFENQHSVAPACGQPIGEHAARGARSDDYVVKALHCNELKLSRLRRYAISRFTHVIFRNPGPSRNGAEPCIVPRARLTQGCTLSTTAIDLPHTRAPSSIERWYVLILTCLIYAINIADRYVVSTVLEPIRKELKLDDAGVAFLTGAPLAFFYVSFGIVISWFADRSNRRNILAASLVIWSAFTTLCGLSRNYLEFLLGRVGVGGGEAGGTPPSTSIVSDCFPPDRRPMAMTVLALGAPIGSWLGANMAGAVAQAYSWRAAFIALGIPGLVVGAIVYLTVREPRRGRLDASVDEIKPTMWDSMRFLWKQKAAFHVVMGGGLCALWGWGLIYWTPTFLQRAYQLDVGQAGAVTGNIHLWGGSAATVGTAWLLSRPSMADPRRVMWLLAAGIGLTTIPSIIAYATHSLRVAELMFCCFIPAIYFYIGPCFGLLNNLAPCRMRNVFIAISLLVANIFNLVVAPQGVGMLSDWFAG